MGDEEEQLRERFQNLKDKNEGLSETIIDKKRKLEILDSEIKNSLENIKHLKKSLDNVAPSIVNYGASTSGNVRDPVSDQIPTSIQNEPTNRQNLTEGTSSKKITRFSGVNHYCEYCGKPFSSAYFVMRHFDRVHLNIDNIQCPYSECRGRFGEIEHLNTHIIAQHQPTTR